MMVCQVMVVVMVSMDDIVVFVIVVGQKKVKSGQDFFLLIVNYQECIYVVGKILGGFFCCEGCLSEGEILIVCLIDCLVCLLFLEGFVNEVQVIVIVVFVNLQVNLDIVVMIGVFVVLLLFGILFNGLIGVVCVGYINDQYVLNLIQEELKFSKLDLVVVGIEVVVLMVEFEVELLSEDQMLGVVVFGYEQQQIVIQNINDLVKEVGKLCWDWQLEVVNEVLNVCVVVLVEFCLSDVYCIIDK